MNRYLSKRYLLAAGMALAALLLVKVHGQQHTQPTGLPISTNWIGCLVVGKEDALDRLAPGPHPFCERQVQIGLRSDGVVVWRLRSK